MLPNADVGTVPKCQMVTRIPVCNEHYPQWRGRVDYYEVSTPVSRQHFSMYEKGEIHGLHHDVDRLRHGWQAWRNQHKLSHAGLACSQISTLG